MLQSSEKSCLGWQIKSANYLSQQIVAIDARKKKEMRPVGQTTFHLC